MSYLSCPKCRHQSLPENQAFPAACPGCGVIFAKLGDAVARATVVQAAPAENDVPAEEQKVTARDGVFAMLFHVPDQVDKLNWYGRMGALAIFLVWTFFIWRDMDIPAGNAGSGFLHLILTPFHEAGHYLIFR